MTNKYYYKLVLLQKRNPELTFNNNGYEYLSKEIIEKHKSQIEEISNILKITVKDFIKFNNFKLRKNGKFSVRCQCKYNVGFTGVIYFNIDDFREFKENDDDK
jgi:hypothetical protein